MDKPQLDFKQILTLQKHSKTDTSCQKKLTSSEEEANCI